MGKIIVISGPSGTGKGKVIEELMKIYTENGEKIRLSVSDTTRSPRPGEIDGVHYNFITRSEFLKKKSEGKYLESNDYKGNSQLYGTPMSEVLNKGYDVVLDIDINGYKQVIEKCPEALGFFVTTPDLETLENRLRGRGTETEEVITKRLTRAKEEIKESGIYPYTIINYDNQSHEAALEIYNVLKGYHKELNKSVM